WLAGRQTLCGRRYGISRNEIDISQFLSKTVRDKAEPSAGLPAVVRQGHSQEAHAGVRKGLHRRSDGMPAVNEEPEFGHVCKEPEMARSLLVCSMRRWATEPTRSSRIGARLQ